MQRIDSRSPFHAVNAVKVSGPGCCCSEILFHGLQAVAFNAVILLVVLAGGLAQAADADNVLLDFTATWCGPCQQMSSIVSRLERQGYAIRKVDVDREPELAAKYGVDSIPAFVLVSEGRELKRATGITSEQQLVSMLKLLQKRPAPRTNPEKRPEWEQGSPRLGAAVPLQEPGQARPPRRLLPIEPPASDEPPALPDSFGEIDIRGQSPELNPFGSSVRIRVKDGGSINYGSGTIIESQPGRATILTCGHIFRNLSKNAVVEIDLYHGPKANKPDTIPGRVLLTDVEADLGLVNVSFPGRLPVMPLGLSRPLSIGEKLFSIGCSRGDHPTRENLELTSLNKYRGPDNLECTTRPQKGRSGGGLFRDEELIGVCVAADPDKPLGLYTGMQPIALLLEKAGLAHVLPAPRSTKPAQSPIAGTTGQAPGTNESSGPAIKLVGVGSDADLMQLLEQHGAEAGVGQASQGAASQDFAGAEVICIVRSKVPGKPSRIVIVNQASDRFVADLLHETTGGTRSGSEVKTAERKPAVGQQGPIETSLQVSPDRRPRNEARTLEYRDAETQFTRRPESR